MCGIVGIFKTKMYMELDGAASASVSHFAILEANAIH